MLWSVKYQENLYGLIKSESYKSTGVSFHSSDYLSRNFGNCYFFILAIMETYFHLGMSILKVE